MKIAILGYGKSGRESENVLKNRGISTIDIYDDNIDEYKNIDIGIV